jgi:hypothetical protein
MLTTVRRATVCGPNKSLIDPERSSSCHSVLHGRGNSERRAWKPEGMLNDSVGNLASQKTSYPKRAASPDDYGVVVSFLYYGQDVTGHSLPFVVDSSCDVTYSNSGIDQYLPGSVHGNW